MYTFVTDCKTSLLLLTPRQHWQTPRLLQAGIKEQMLWSHLALPRRRHCCAHRLEHGAGSAELAVVQGRLPASHGGHHVLLLHPVQRRGREQLRADGRHHEGLRRRCRLPERPRDPPREPARGRDRRHDAGDGGDGKQPGDLDERARAGRVAERGREHPGVRDAQQRDARAPEPLWRAHSLHRQWHQPDHGWHGHDRAAEAG